MSAITACSADSAGSRHSFVIEAASAHPAAAPSLRLDRINSSTLLAAARQIYFEFLTAAASGDEPIGVVLTDLGAARGRVVFSRPVLLPHEEFVALELVCQRQYRSGGGRSGSGRSRLQRTVLPQ
jgi:hypothetical protein